MLNVAHACVTREVNGPGRRFTVWVQGCARECLGCFNPELRPFAPRRLVVPADLAREAAAAAPVDGVSLSGGEPFAQATALASFLDALQAGSPGITALAFTGYTLEVLRRGPAAWRELLERLDLLVDGPYREELAADLPLRGSANQKLIPLTAAGEALKRAAETSSPALWEVLVGDDGGVLFTGFPPRSLVDATLRGLGSALGPTPGRGGISRPGQPIPR